jgi:hypothetical protein
MMGVFLLGLEIFSQAGREFNPGGGVPGFITVYDVDGDKNLDVLVSTAGTGGGLRLMRGDGTGSLSTGERLFAGTNVNSVFAGDFDRDGFTDLAIARSVGLFLLYGDGKGGFKEPEQAELSIDPPSTPIMSVTGADFDGDNYLDLVITNSTNRLGQGAVTLFRGREEGGFDFANPERFSVGPRNTLPRFVAATDLNGDGYPDLVVSNQVASNVVIFLWNPAEDRFNLTETISLGTGRQPNYIATGDFNKDGRMDIAVANFGTRSVSIFFGDGRGGFDTQTARTIPTGEEPYVISADFNEDGFLDLAVSNFNTNNISIFYGNGRGEFSAPRNLAVGMGPRVLAAGDFNGDKLLDLVVANSRSNTITLILGDGKGGFLTSE